MERKRDRKRSARAKGLDTRRRMVEVAGVPKGQSWFELIGPASGESRSGRRR